jgi:DNA mismatch repair ATPase MutL
MHYLLSLIPFEHSFDEEEKQFMKDHIDLYSQCRIFIQDLQDAGIMISGIPIKLHTLKEKSKLITNIDQCLINYNKWISYTQPSFALEYRPETLDRLAELEHTSWVKSQSGTALTYTDINQERLMLADLKFPEPAPQNNQQS